MAFNTIDKWLSSASGTIPLEYIISIDNNEPDVYRYESNFSSLVLKHSANNSIRLVKNNNENAIQAINYGATLTTQNLIIVVSDDFDCFPNWDIFLINALKDKKDFVVKTSDGIQDYIITLPIMDREYYNRFNYIYNPEYQHMFCDTEMTDVGHLLGKVIDLKCPNHVFVHRHYSVNLMAKDSINERNDATWIQGENLYYSRKANQFYLNL
jgi:hypothetical protein